ncbi:MAG: aldo/keto reductase [Nitrospirota bacterium]|nr:aldo/keto reductase [Nitrospirota bacterium]
MKEGNHPNRRDFLWQSLGLLWALNLPSRAWSLQATKPIPKRPLGKTGVSVSILGLGGSHVGTIQDEAQAVRLVREAIDLGVTFLDNAWEYHHGRSEEIVGKALQGGYRQKAFLMTKVHGRDKKSSLSQLEDSLRRLKTDVIDLWQFHEVVYEDDPDLIFAKDGGIEAAYEAKKSGKVRFVGFTGHKDPKIHLDMLSKGYDWDTVQMPVNVLDAHFRSFQKQVLPVLVERNIGAIAMKTLADGHLLKAGVVTPREALTYVWSQPVSTIVSGMDSLELVRNQARLASNFVPLSAEEQEKLLQRTAKAAKGGAFEPFKTSNRYDGWKGREIHGIPLGQA